MDHITVKGIHQRTGIAEEELMPFVLKELLDNALDVIEKYGRGARHQVKVTLTKGKIVVANSNFGIEPFTKDILESLFTFERFYSEKRNIYKVSRGMLGDALKEVLSIPYALSSHYGNDNWDLPLKIDGNNLSHSIHLEIDRIRQEIGTKIDTRKKASSGSDVTTIEFSYPDTPGVLKCGLRNFLLEYSILNPHISFELDCFADHDSETDGNLSLNKSLPQTQEIKADWVNRPSIWYYTPSDWKQLINGLEYNEAVIYDVLKRLNFREVTNVPRSGAMAMTVKQLKMDSASTSKVYLLLREALKANKILKTHFELKKEVRRDAIKKRIEQLGFDVTGVKYRLVQEHYSHGEIKFPYVFEIGFFYTELNYSCTVEGLNSSYRPSDPFAGKYQDTYVWLIGKKEKGKTASSVFEILQKYGYGSSKEDSKKTAIIVINLISPRIDYEGYSKSHINLEPFASTIAENVYKIASQSAPVNAQSPITGKDIVREILNERFYAVRKNSDLLTTDKWTQSSVYYRTRKRMLEYNVRLTGRKTITEQIRAVCESWGTKREDIGVFAADRAQLYFRGDIHDVGVGELQVLKERGTDLIIIEKEGVAEVLSPFAAKCGVAILNTRGFLTDYARDLSELFEHVAILTDLDDSGLVLANKVPEVPRIGIDFETLEYFGLDPSNVEEGYKPQSHLTNLRVLSEKGLLDAKSELLLPYIEDKRIEIDSILSEVGNERFWEFIAQRILEVFPNRDYNRAVKKPGNIIPRDVEEIISAITTKCNDVTEITRKEIENDLQDYEGFIDNVDEKDHQIEYEIRKTLSEDKEIKLLIAELEEIKRKYLSKP